MKQSSEKKIKKFHKKRQLNIGIIFYSFIFIYLVVTIIGYLTKEEIVTYEVRQGSIVNDMSYTGIAIRQEKVVRATSSGYVNYYLQNNSKVAKGTKLYTLSDEELAIDSAQEEKKIQLTDDQLYSVYMQIQDFRNRYHNGSHDAVYQTKESITSALQDAADQSRVDMISRMIKEGTLESAKLCGAKDDGIVVYSTDGMEDLKKSTVTPTMLNKTDYQKTNFTNNRPVQEGDVLYKLVTSENWSVYIPISEETYQTLKDNTYVKVKFAKDEMTMTAGLKFKKSDEGRYAFLTFSNAMIRYVNDRYLDVELILEDESGLKIPKTAVTQKEFFVVPDAYISHGGNSSSDGVLRKTKDKHGKEITEFIVATIYYEDTENGVVYLDPNEFQEDDILLKENSNDTFLLGEKASLPGVYQVNKGYAVFKQIRVLCESEIYYIVEDGNDYGLSNYDHIVLDAKTVKENEIVF